MHFGRGGVVSRHLHKVGVFGISDSDHSVHLLDQLLLLIVIKLHVPLGQARLACPVLDEDEADLGAAGGGGRERGGEGGPVLGGPAQQPHPSPQGRQGPRVPAACLPRVSAMPQSPARLAWPHAPVPGPSNTPVISLANSAVISRALSPRLHQLSSP